ncbi:MAG TPA: MFS transporter [Nitrososphaeraceae archaeon]|jgi:MFS family permease|nr:MFS transporter [Nitrososphaeraceae archaeon]
MVEDDQTPDNKKNVIKRQPSSDKTISASAWITIAILGSTLLITMYGETMLLPAIPDIIKEFHISYNMASWILTAYLIAGAVMTPISGKLSDMYGRKKIILIIMMIYVVGICLGGISRDINFLIIVRIIQGIGVSMFPIAFGIIRDQLPPEKLAIGVGIFSSMFAAGSVIGLAAGGSIIENLGWRATFLSIIPFAIGLWIIIRRFIYDIPYPSQLSQNGARIQAQKQRLDGHTNVGSVSSKSTQSIDISGAITLAVTVTSFLLALSYLKTGNNNTIFPFQIMYFITAGSISLILFIFIEKRAKSPLIDFKLITNKIILPANILLTISFLTMFTVYQTIPVLVRSPYPVGLGGNASTTAGIQIPFMIVFLLFAPSSGFIISKLGNTNPTIIGSIIGTVGFFSIFMLHSTGFLLAVNLSVIAVGLSLIQVGGFNIVLESTPRELSGTSLGTTVLLNLIGGAVGPAVAGIFMQTNQVFVRAAGGYFPSSQSYELIFFTSTILSLVTIALAIIIKKRSLSKNEIITKSKFKTADADSK